jgi:hypothetical protein
MGCPVMVGHKWVLTKWLYADDQVKAKLLLKLKISFKKITFFCIELTRLLMTMSNLVNFYALFEAPIFVSCVKLNAKKFYKLVPSSYFQSQIIAEPLYTLRFKLL